MEQVNYSPETNNDVLIDYNDLLLQSYKQNVDGNIIFATIFKVDKNRSTNGENSESYLTKVDSINDAIKYIKIDKFPLYNVEQMQSSVNWDFENGYRSNETMFSCSVIPTSIELKNGDFVEINLINNVLIFEVQDNITESHVHGSKFKRLSLKAVSYTSDDLILQTIKEITYNFEKDTFNESSELEYISSIFNNVDILYTDAIGLTYSKNTGNFNYNDSGVTDNKSIIISNLFKNYFPSMISVKTPMVYNNRVKTEERLDISLSGRSIDTLLTEILFSNLMELTVSEMNSINLELIEHRDNIDTTPIGVEICTVLSNLFTNSVNGQKILLADNIVNTFFAH